MPARPAQASPPRVAVPGSPGNRLLVGLLGASAGLLGRLPERLLHVLAAGAGGLLYLARPSRRTLVRANLERVCAHLAQQGLVGANSPVQRAAADRRALERLVRAAFGHYVRSYLETLIVPAYARSGRLMERITADDPRLVLEAFGLGSGEPRAAIVVALHFGAIELPGLWATQQGLRVTAPMETLSNAELQRFFERNRGASGLRLVPARGAGRELSQALERGELVALVSDRLVEGSGARVELFGAETRLPIGPAVLALESAAPAWLVACRRTGRGSYRVHIERIELPAEGSRRERLAAFLRAQASAYERAIALAPEQWWTLFFPIWTGHSGDERR